MKKLLSVTLVSAALLAMTFTACKKKDDDKTTPTYTCASCKTTPDAVAANDNASKGIYKGVIVGSSGTIKFDIMNNDTTIKAYMTIDGVSVTLTATVAWQSGQSFVSPFTGTMNGEPVSITFSVNGDGSSPTVTAMTIPGHPNASLTLSKETSTNLIKCFEGTYTNITTGEKGNFNLFMSSALKKWSARSKADGATNSGGIEGTIDGDKLNFTIGNEASGTATLSGDKIINGTFTSTKPENGTWEGNRTL